MRLIGYSCRRREPPLRQVHLPLDALTVLLGRNDSGKSSLLRAIVADLAGGHYADTGRDEWRYAGGVFFADASERELAHVIREGAELRRRDPTRRQWYRGSRPPYDQFSAMREFEPANDDAAIAEWLEKLTTAGTTDGWRDVVEALAQSRTIGLEPAGHDDDRVVWNVYWCLPPFDALAADVQAALEQSDLQPFAARRRRQEAHVQGVEYVAGRGFYSSVNGTPFHLWVEGAPVVVSAIGQARSLHLPRGLAVPGDFGELRREVARSLNDLVSTARYALEDAHNDWYPLTAEQRHARTAPRNWLEHGDSEWQVAPDARGAASFIAAAANRMLPRFLSLRYVLDVSIRPIGEWVGDDGRALDLLLVERRDDGVRSEFPVEQAADGLQLWLHLALLQACELAAKVGRELAEVASDWAEFDVDASRAFQAGDEERAEQLSDEATDRQETFEAMLEELRTLSPTGDDWIEGGLVDRLGRGEPDDWTLRHARHRRFFVVDEPERHLHPNLQREAATWLRDTAREHGAPCLVATHSAPFLGLPSNGGGPSYVYVRRDSKRVTCEQFDAGQLKSLDEIVTSLGFDRGELLTTVSLFLVVEGIHDVVVLDQVFDELRAARIALLPMEGLANYKAVLEADALWRYTTAEVALTTDKFDRARLQTVIGDPQAARRLRRSEAPDETKLLAKLIGLAELNGKTIHLMGHRGADLIDVLDEDIVQQEFPDYPGHAEAARLWDIEARAGAKAAAKKTFYQQRFGLPMQVESYQRIGRALAEAKRKPAALKAIVDDAVRVALGEPPADALTVAPR